MTEDALHRRLRKRAEKAARLTPKSLVKPRPGDETDPMKKKSESFRKRLARRKP